MPAPSIQSIPPRAESLAACFSTSCAGVIAFVSVASEGSFARAADRLGIGRSAVSRSVQKLEEQLGARLLRRTTRSVSLTGEGEVFYEACRPGVEKIVAAMEGVRDLREGPPSGMLKVRATQGFGRQVIAPLLSEFRARYPELAVELLLDEGVVDFSADRVDVAFCDGPLQDSQVVARQLLPVRMQVCASADYARRHRLPTTVDALASHDCINLRLPNGRLQAWQFQVDGRKRSLTPNARIVFNDSALVLQSVRDGHGLAQLAACQVRDAVRSGELVTCLADVAPDDRSHYLCYPSRKQLPNRVRAFVDFMTSRIREPC